MRTLRYLAFLLVGLAAFASDKPAPSDTNLQPQMEWKTPVRGPDGTLQFRTLPDPARLRVGRIPPEVLERFLGDSTCYYIRSYQVKRVDGTDETVPAGMTTCTRSSRFKLRQAVPRK